MRPLGILIIAFRSISRNKLRSFLTMLGIIIGVAAVIAMLAVGQGARDAVSKQIADLGTNVLIIFPGAPNQGGVRLEAGSGAHLTEEDAQAIPGACPSVTYVSPLVRTSSQVKFGNQNWRTSINGVYPEYLQIRDWAVSNGNDFSSTDERGATKVCLLGQTVVTNLFGTDINPVGQVVRIKNLPFKSCRRSRCKGTEHDGAGPG